MLEVPANMPKQPQHQQPAPATSYSSEPQMNSTAGDEVLSKVTVALDKDAMTIIQEASAIHGETIVNLGIKLFAKTNMYKEFMVKQEFKALNQSTDDLVELTDIAVSDTVSTTHATNTVASTQKTAGTITAPSTSGGFNAW